MSDSNAVELCRRSDGRFSRRASLDTFRQEVALQFCPWLAGWTSEITLGEDFASHLVDGTPLLLARDFKAQVGSMLRPSGKQWFWQRTPDDDLNADRDARDYMDWRSRTMMRALFDPVTGAHRALEQADGFFAWFGDAVISVDYGEDMASLRLLCHHTKDCVWVSGEDNRIDVITRREMASGRNILRRFRRPGDRPLHERIKASADKGDDREFEIRHDVMPADDYEAIGGKKRKKDGFVSIWTDVTNKQILRESYHPTARYVVPRWVTMPHTPYAISPATTIALPDARLIQEQALLIMEAAEVQTAPPAIAYGEALRGAPTLKSRAINYVDKTYDSRTGKPIEPIELGKNFRLGVDALLRTEQQITRAFYLDVLRMPDTRSSKSTLEVQHRIDEYVRAALPLFAPMQVEYNEALLREVNALIEGAKGYASRPKPKILKDQVIQFQWDNPLTEMMERSKIQMVGEIGQIANVLAGLEMAAAQASSLKQLNSGKALRDTIIAIGGSSWMLSESDVKREQAALGQQAQMQQAVAAAPNIAQLIDSGVGAAQATAELPMQSEGGPLMLPAPE
jgi:hypothetical protein